MTTEASMWTVELCRKNDSNKYPIIHQNLLSQHKQQSQGKVCRFWPHVNVINIGSAQVTSTSVSVITCYYTQCDSSIPPQPWCCLFLSW